MNRRQFLRLTIGLGAAAATSSPLELIAEDKETISETEIAKLMSRATVEDILKEEHNTGKIQYVKANPDGTTNYDELVYQKEAKTKKPVIVFCYKAGKESLDPQKRLAIIFNKLAQAYTDKITFVAYDISSDKYRIARREEVKAFPSLVMYSHFDVVKGETHERNEGSLKRIDILRSGPLSNESTTKWYNDISERWIDSNITKPNGQNAIRFGNRRGNPKEVLYNQR